MTVHHDAHSARSDSAHRRVYVDGNRADVRVPFREVTLTGDHAPVRLYDTTGPDCDPNDGLPPMRLAWIRERGDVDDYEGRPPSPRDDGRAAGRGDRSASEAFTGEGARRTRLRAKPGGCVTQLHYARRGEITPEMEFVAIRECCDPELVRDEVARGRAIIPANVNHPESER